MRALPVAAAVLAAAALAGCARRSSSSTAPGETNARAPVPLLSADGATSDDDRPPPHLVSRGGEAMGTVVEMKVFTRDDDRAREAMARAFDEIARIERLMTTWRADSDVSRVNAAAGVAPVVVSPETFECVARAQHFSELSHGAFDITFYAMKGLWKFDQDLDPRLPDPAEVKRRLPLINYRKLRLDEKKRTLFLVEKGMRINLGGIAKGYAVDRATAVLRDAGFRDVIVQAGGDLMLSGDKGGQAWQAGIRDPRAPRDDYFAVAPVRNHAFSTAGDYERTFFVGGKRYHHIIDPRTGYPATAARSVTIYAPDATTADGLDDAVLILGPKEGLAMIERLPDVGAVVVDRDNKVWISKRLDGVVHVVHPPTDGP